MLVHWANRNSMVQWVLVEVVRVARRVALALALALQWQGRSVVVVLCPSIVVVVDGKGADREKDEVSYARTEYNA